jgi:hypothetical protein
MGSKQLAWARDCLLTLRLILFNSILSENLLAATKLTKYSHVYGFHDHHLMNALDIVLNPDIRR